MKCVHCLQEKESSDFSGDKSCKVCLSGFYYQAKNTIMRLLNKVKHARDTETRSRESFTSEYVSELKAYCGYPTCTSCGQTKKYWDFPLSMLANLHLVKHYGAAYRTWCRDCNTQFVSEKRPQKTYNIRFLPHRNNVRIGANEKLAIDLIQRQAYTDIRQLRNRLAEVMPVRHKITKGQDSKRKVALKTIRALEKKGIIDLGEQIFKNKKALDVYLANKDLL